MAKEASVNPDRILPHEYAAEPAVLGSILIDNSKLPVALESLAHSHFYKEANGRICQAMGRLADRGYGIDEITLRDELVRTGELEVVGGPAYVSALAD